MIVKRQTALILAGGKGTRLWPLSRENYPKQFVEFKDKFSLFQLTIKRLLSVFNPARIFFIAQKQYQFTIINQIELMPGISEKLKSSLKQNIIFEPQSRNTLPAITLALKYLEEKKSLKDSDLIYVFPSDHIIEPVAKFRNCLNSAASLANQDKIVVFGVKPDSPKEGYGYILVNKKFDQGYLVGKFVEKPSPQKAKGLMKRRAFWNAGIFCFSKKVFLGELRAFCPKLNKYYNLGLSDFIKNFNSIAAVSMDYGIMQKTGKAALVKFGLNWSDLGSWDSFLDFYAKGKGNFSIGKAEFIKSANCFSRSEKRLISFVGLKDVVAIDSSDALLLVKKGDSDQVKELVEQINAKGRLHTKEGLTVYRPWGYYTVLHEEKNYKVKEIGIYPGKSLSLQKHKFRSEHWNIVDGKIRVWIGGRENTMHRNESIFVPKEIRHKVYNPTKKIAKIIEVQIGSYLGEDDITRFPPRA